VKREVFYFVKMYFMAEKTSRKGMCIMKRIYLSETDSKIGGVCGGIGEYFDKDPTIIRLLYILVVLFSFGFGVVAYLVMWLVIPRRPRVGNYPETTDAVRPQQ
jgi:Putative stress-responsive transcriptional regulator